MFSKIESLLYDDGVKENHPLILRAEGYVHLVGEKLGWTTNFQVKYKNKDIISFFSCDYKDAFELANEAYEKCLKAVEAIEENITMYIERIEKYND